MKLDELIDKLRTIRDEIGDGKAETWVKAFPEEARTIDVYYEPFEEVVYVEGD